MRPIRNEISHVASRRGRPGRTAAARRVFGRDRVAARAGDLHAARSTQHASSRGRNQAAALRADVHLSGIFVRDYLLDTVRERAPEYRANLANFRETNRATLQELLDIAQPPRRRRNPHPQPRGQPARLLGGLRAALRLDDRREDQQERRLPAPRSPAAPRRGARDRRRRSKSSTTRTSPRSAPR